jgi:hypothetical protein
MQALAPLCSAINDIPGTAISTVWFLISYAFSNYWYFIIPAIVIWIVAEVLTRNSHSFNSNNGFTPIFNSFIGGGVFYIFGALIHFILSFFVGKGVDCGLIWINLFYLVPFFTTGLFLHGIGFWPYMKIPIVNVKANFFGRNSKW